MASKKVSSVKTVEAVNVNVLEAEVANNIADNVIDNLNSFFYIHKIQLNEFLKKDFQTVNTEFVSVICLFRVLLSTIPYFHDKAIALNVNSKNVITSVFLIDADKADSFPCLV